MRAVAFSVDDAFMLPFKVLFHSLMATDSLPPATPVFVLHEDSLGAESVGDEAASHHHNLSPCFNLRSNRPELRSFLGFLRLQSLKLIHTQSEFGDE